MTPFSSPGFFYLPDREERLVAGTLSYDEESGLELRLVGTLREKGGFSTNLSEYSIVRGTLSDSPYGKSVSLLGCQPTNVRIGVPGVTLETIKALHGFVGHFYVESEQEKFEEVGFSFSHLGVWIAHSHIGVEFRPNDAEKIRMTYKWQEPIVCELDGVTISTALAVNTHEEKGAERVVSMTERAFWQLKGFGQATIEEINSRFHYPLSKLLAFAADESTSTDRYQVYVTIDGRQHVSDHLYQPMVNQRVKKKPRSSHEMLFNLGDVHDRYQAFMQAWFSFVKEQEAFVNLFFSYGYGHRSYLEDRFQFLAVAVACYLRDQPSAVDTLHSFEAMRAKLLESAPSLKGPNSVQMMSSAAELAMPTLLDRLIRDHWHLCEKIIGTTPERFQEVLFATLHYVSKRGKRSADALQGGELFWLIERLSWLMKICVLKRLGFTDERIPQLLQRNGMASQLTRIKSPWEPEAATETASA